MIRIIILTMLGSFAIQAYAQRCGTPDVDMSEIKQNDPARYQRMMQMEQQIAAFTSRQSSASSHEVNEVFTIPVVVHVVHNGENPNTGLNISNAHDNSRNLLQHWCLYRFKVLRQVKF